MTNNEGNLFGDELKEDDPSITIFTSENGKLNKTIHEDGTKTSNALLYKGKFVSKEIASLKVLQREIKKIKPTQALGLGVNKHSAIGVITSRNNNPKTARSKENFIWNKNTNIVLLDYDYFDGLKECNNAHEYRDTLIDIDPIFANVEMLILPSSSSRIYKNNKLFVNSKGLHCYLMINGDVDKFKDTLWYSCWAKGYGAIKLASDGSVLPRTIFDKAVFSPERLIFEAAPNLDDGLFQEKLDPYYRKGIILNVDHMEDNIAKGQKIEAEDKFKSKDKSKLKNEEYIQTNVKKLVKVGRTEKEAIEIVKARVGEHGVIFTSDIITLLDGTNMNAGDLTRDHNGLYCLDPIEPTQAPAVINISDENKNIWSFLHGGKNYEIIEPNNDVQLEISNKAIELSIAYRNILWLKEFGFETNDKLYENWEIMFQSYINASAPTFIEQMYLVGTSAGNGKTTSLAFYIAQTIKEDPDFNVLIVVNTIRNARELQKTINKLITINGIPTAHVLHSSDGKAMIDGKLDYSDIKEKEAPEHPILIITHAKLQLAVRQNNTNNIRVMNNGKERTLTVIDEAIDFAETATIKLNHIEFIITYLTQLLRYRKDFKSAIKLKDVLDTIAKQEIQKTGSTLQPEELFGKNNLNLKIEEDIIEELEKEKSFAFSIRSFIKDLEILSRADGFVMDIGGREGIMYSSSKDKLPSGKGLVILDASASINQEYKHYITNKKASRIRINQDARSYAQVTIHTAVTRDNVGKIRIDLKDDENVKMVNKRTNLLINEVMHKTNADDKILIIANKDYIETINKNGFGSRDVICEHWNNLTGRNDLRDRNKVFVITLPFKPLIHSYNLAHKHNQYGNDSETTLFQYSNIADDVYQAIMRANLRTTSAYSTDAPKCDIYIILPANKGKLRNLIKKKIGNLLLDCNWSDWEFNTMNNEQLFSISPPYQPSETLLAILDSIEKWSNVNDKHPYVTIDTLADVAKLSIPDYKTKEIKQILAAFRKALSRKLGQSLDEFYTGTKWLEDVTGEFTYFSSFQSNQILKDIGFTTKGRGKAIFLRNQFL
jgi:hypothetical protein